MSKRPLMKYYYILEVWVQDDRGCILRTRYTFISRNIYEKALDHWKSAVADPSQKYILHVETWMEDRR